VTPPRVEGASQHIRPHSPPRAPLMPSSPRAVSCASLPEHLDYGCSPAELTAEAESATGSLASGFHACEQSAQLRWRVNGAAFGTGSPGHQCSWAGGGNDCPSGLTHSVLTTTTADNLHDLNPAADLLHSEEGGGLFSIEGMKVSRHTEMTCKVPGCRVAKHAR